MFRSLLAGLLAAGVVLAAARTETTAQDRKAPPKKRERIAIPDPKDAAKDDDFAIQGEYEGERAAAGKDAPQGAAKGEEQPDVSQQQVKVAGKFGVQVVAKGDGKFAIKALKGGLPGAGWDGKAVLTSTAETKDGKVVATMKSGAETSTATIADGKLTISVGSESFVLKKVERKSKTLGEKPPQGAVVLWAAEGDEKNWDGGRLADLSDGKFLTVARVANKGGDIRTKEKFGAFKAHVEFRLPWMPNSSGQGRGNSGVYLQDRYECQVLDSFGLAGENNECGGIYTQYKPLVNMCLPPLVWQTYDIEFTPAEFGADGKKAKPARATIYHNGVKIHDNIEFKGPTGGGQPETKEPGPFQFQDHGDPVVYRNVWAVPVK